MQIVHSRTRLEKPALITSSYSGKETKLSVKLIKEQVENSGIIETTKKQLNKVITSSETKNKE